MPSIEILGTGRIDDRDSAFPQAVELSDGTLLCSFSVGGGPRAEGCTDLARSLDGGLNWEPAGTICPATTDPWSTNCLRISKAPDSDRLYAYGSRSTRPQGGRFGEGRNEGVICRSEDGGATWSGPRAVPMHEDCALEISYSAVALASCRLLAPAATLPVKGRLGETVVVAVSDDGGESWPSWSTVFRDPAGKLGYFEHKFTELAPDLVMAVCWTVTMADVADQPNSFCISQDGGSTWGPAQSTGIMGQTMAPVALGGDRLLVLYNRRYGQQGVVMLLVTFSDVGWTVHHESMMYDVGATRVRPGELADGVDEFDAFEFGFPTAIRLRDGTFLATHWCKEAGSFGIRWSKLSVEWA